MLCSRNSLASCMSIDAILLDYLNFTISEAAPTLINEGIGYEQRAFAQQMQSRPLDSAKRWWRNASLASDNANGGRGLQAIHARGLVDLVMAPNFHEENIPETLFLDTLRLHNLHATLKRMVSRWWNPTHS